MERVVEVGLYKVQLQYTTDGLRAEVSAPAPEQHSSVTVILSRDKRTDRSPGIYTIVTLETLIQCKAEGSSHTWADFPIPGAPLAPITKEIINELFPTGYKVEFITSSA